jgi:hypothetical protein
MVTGLRRIGALLVSVPFQRCGCLVHAGIIVNSHTKRQNQSKIFVRFVFLQISPPFYFPSYAFAPRIFGSLNFSFLSA